MKTMSTGQVTTKLGVMITRQFIESLGVTPAEMVKGYPRWAVSDWAFLCMRLSEHMASLAGGPPEGTESASVAPKVADDDEL